MNRISEAHKFYLEKYARAKEEGSYTETLYDQSGNAIPITYAAEETAKGTITVPVLRRTIGRRDGEEKVDRFDLSTGRRIRSKPAQQNQ